MTSHDSAADTGREESDSGSVPERVPLPVEPDDRANVRIPSEDPTSLADSTEGREQQEMASQVQVVGDGLSGEDLSGTGTPAAGSNAASANGTTAPTRPLLRVQGLRMSFGDKEVLKGLDFEVGRGEIFGFIGPNGAGKTTTIRILATLLHPSAGNVWLDDVHVVERPDIIRRRIGYMPDYVGVYPGLTVRDYLEFFAGAYRLRGAARTSLLDDVLELTDLKRHVDVEVQVLSKGMRQRLCLAQTLIHDPDLLILDEPASGLDPRARIEFRALLKELRRMNKTIFLSSHILTELSPICDSVGIIEAGELIASGKVQTILDQLRKDAVVYRVQLANIPDAGDSILAELRTHPKVARTEIEGHHLQFQYDGKDDDLHEVFGILTRLRVSFVHVERNQGDLETIFMQLTRGEVS